MNASEQLIYVLRLMVISASAIILVLILSLTQFQVGSTQHYHADNDVYTVLQSAEFWQEPGIIDTSAYRQEAFDALNQRQGNSYATFLLEKSSGNVTLTLHPQIAERLQALRSLDGIYSEKHTLPVILDTGEIAKLHVEVVYELQ